MGETANEYRLRIMGEVEDRDALSVLAASAEKLRELVRGVPDEELVRQPKSGTWSPAQIMAHLADCEIVYGYRMRLILCSPGVAIQAFDQDRWAEELEYAARPAAASLEAFTAARAYNLHLLRSLRTDQWQRFGEHAERGPETVEMIAAMLAGHDLNHIRQVEERLPKPEPAAEPIVEPASLTSDAI